MTATEASRNIRKRVSATLFHLAVTAVALVALTWVTRQLWYPGVLFMTDGGWQGLRMLVPIVLVLGPLLTFIVFRPGKPGLVTDMTLILTLQILVFGAGSWIAWQERTLALVHHDGRVYTLSPADYSSAGLPVPDLTHLPGARPYHVRATLPNSPSAEAELRSRMFRQRRPLYTHADGFVPVSRPARDLLAEGLPAKELVARGAGQGLTGFQDSVSEDGHAFVYLPYASRYRFGFLAVDPDNGDIKAFIALPEGQHPRPSRRIRVEPNSDSRDGSPASGPAP